MIDTKIVQSHSKFCLPFPTLVTRWKCEINPAVLRNIPSINQSSHQLNTIACIIYVKYTDIPRQTSTKRNVSDVSGGRKRQTFPRKEKEQKKRRRRTDVTVTTKASLSFEYQSPVLPTFCTLEHTTHHQEGSSKSRRKAKKKHQHTKEKGLLHAVSKVLRLEKQFLISYKGCIM